MTGFMPTCEEVVALLTDYEEGALGPLDWLGLKLHLAICPPCQGFLTTFERTPALLRRLAAEETVAAGPVGGGAEQALAGALAALREGRIPRGPQLHPEPAAWAALQPGGDPLLALLLRVHLGHCGTCRGTQGEGHALPPSAHPLDALRPHLPPESQWSWSSHGLGGAQVARVMVDPISGSVLSVARLQGGRRVPRHDHLGQETSVLLCGGLQDGPAHLAPGDWIAHAQGHRHAPAADPRGECWALVRLEGGIRFEGWRALFGVVR